MRKSKFTEEQITGCLKQAEAGTHRALWNLEDRKFTKRLILEIVAFLDGARLTMPK